jgi:hypothetical protein
MGHCADTSTMDKDEVTTGVPDRPEVTVGGIDTGLLVSLLLTGFAILPLLTHVGLPNTADGPVHLMRQAELNQAWADGIVYPRWAPDLAYGYGMPLFSYAPPLLYHVTQALHLSGLALDEAMKGTMILMMVLCGVGMYLLGRDLFGPRAGLLAAAAYLYAPYRLREAYVQGNYGQFCGLALYPLVLWSFYRLATGKEDRFLLLASLSLAGLVLSHNISFMLFAPLLLAYLLHLVTICGAASRPMVVLRLTMAAALGLGLSAFFWLPAFGERDSILLSGITTGFFDFRRNFIELGELLALPRPLDQAAINPYFPLSLGLAQIVLVLGASVALVACGIRRSTLRGCEASAPRRGQVRHAEFALVARHVLFFAVALVVYAFLALPESRGVWERLPLLELAEFPWRMLGPAVLCAAMLAAALVRCCEMLAARAALLNMAGRSVMAAGMVLTLAANMYYLFPSSFVLWGTPTPADVMRYETSSKAIGTTSTGEFLPRWAGRYPSPGVIDPPQTDGGAIASRLDPASLPQGATSVTLRHTARETVMSVDSPVPFVAIFRALYWPGWQVWASQDLREDLDQVHGWQLVQGLEVTRPDGLMRAPLPAGRYLVMLRLDDTPLRTAGTLVSLASLIVCVGFVVVARRWPVCAGGVWSSATARSYPPREAALIMIVVVIALLLTRPLGDWLRVQSPSGAVRGVQYPLETPFGNQVQLLGYDLPACQSWLGSMRWAAGLRCSRPVAGQLPELEMHAGDTLPAVLYWQALQPLSSNYSVFLHLDALDGRTYAGVDETNPEDILTSTWPPGLYLRNPMSLTLPADAPAVRYTLTVGLYEPHTLERLAAETCGGCAALPLATVWLLPTRPLDQSAVPYPLDYRLGEDISLLGYGLEPGDMTQLTLYWRAKLRLPSDYTVFIHAYDGLGNLLARADSPPGGGLYPTDAWLPGQLIADLHTLELPAATRLLAVGLYDPATMTRLPVVQGSDQPVRDNAILIQVPRGTE